MKKEDDQALVKVDPIVMPAVSPDEAVKAWQAYQNLKSKIVDKSDVQVIEGRDFLKKSYWRKLATFFNITVEVIDEKRWDAGKDNYCFEFVCKATAPNGRSAVGSGSCDQYDKSDKYRNSLHNTRSTAETRAFNRAVSNLVGGGEVSAEEVAGEPERKGRGRPAKKELSPEAKSRLEEIKQMLDDLHGDNDESKKGYLINKTKFTKRDGGEYPGVDNPDRLSENQLMKGPMYNQIRSEWKEYKEYMEGEGEGGR